MKEDESGKPAAKSFKQTEKPHNIKSEDGETHSKNSLKKLLTHQQERAVLRSRKNILHQIQEGLEETKDKYINLLGFTSTGYFVLDKEGSILEVNLAGANMLAVNKPDMVNSKFLNYIDPNFYDIFDLYCKLVFKTKAPQSCELKLLRDKGESFYVQTTSQVLPDGKDSFTQQILITDISERRRTEKALDKRTHELGKRVKELNCLYAFSLLREKHDLSQEALLLRTVKLIPSAWQFPETADAQIILENQTFQTKHFRKTPWQQTAEIIVRNEKVGSITVCYQQKKPLFDEGPFLKEERLLIKAIASQIARYIEHKRAEKALWEKKEERYRILFENASDAIFIHDLEGHLLEVNQRACNYLGYSKEELLQMSHKDLISSEYAALIPEQLEKLRESGNLVIETNHMKKDGTTIPLEVGVQLIEYAGRPTVFTIARDLTERKQTERAIQTLVASIVGATGQECFDKIIRGLCDWLKLDCAVIGELMGDNSIKARAMILDGQVIHDFSYALAGTPCENVVKKGYCYYPQNVCELFPNDQDLVRLKAEGYAGTPLWDKDNRPIGVLCVVSRRKLEAMERIQEVMEIVAVKAASEIERERSEVELAKLAKFPDECPNPILRIAKNGEILYHNKASSSLLDFWRCRVEKHLSGQWADYVQEALAAGSPREIEAECCNQIFSLTFAPVAKYGYVNVYGLNITERKWADKELLNSEKRLLKAQHVAKMGFWDWNLQTDKIFLSGEAIHLFGLKPVNLWEMPDLLTQVVHPDDLAYVQQNLEMAIQSAREYNIDHRVVRPNGEILWVHAQAELTYDVQGTPSFLLGTVVDVTERKRVEEALKKNERNYKALVHNIPGMIYRGNPDWSAEFFNGSEEICGYSLEELNAKENKWLSLIHPEDKERVFLEGSKLVEKQQDIVQIYRIITKEGDLRWVEDHKASVFSEAGEFDGIEGVILNVTERKRAEKALRASQEKYKQLYQLSPLGIAVYDLEGCYLFVNQAYCQMFKRTENELIGKSYIEIKIPSEKRAKELEWLKKLTQVQPKIEPFEKINVRGDKRKIIVRSYGDYTRDNNGKITGFIFYGEEITERKQAEEILKFSEERLREQNLALEQKNIDLKEILEQIASEKVKITENVLANVDKLLMPTLKKLKKSPVPFDSQYLDMLQNNLEELASSFGSKISEKKAKLAPKEIEICNLIKSGLTTKEIATLLNISLRTVEGYRKNIRKKLGLSHQDINLTSYLQTL